MARKSRRSKAAKRTEDMPVPDYLYLPSRGHGSRVLTVEDALDQMEARKIPQRVVRQGMDIWEDLLRENNPYTADEE